MGFVKRFVNTKGLDSFMPRIQTLFLNTVIGITVSTSSFLEVEKLTMVARKAAYYLTNLGLVVSLRKYETLHFA